MGGKTIFGDRMNDMCLKYADYIIGLSIKNQNKLTNTMLQKILFYSYVNYARVYKEPMFQESFYAWKNGPVVPMIYDNYNIYQDGHMKMSNKEELLTDNVKIKILETWYCALINKDIKKIIDKTHNGRENSGPTPWAKHYSNDLIQIITTDYDKIPFDEILSYYLNDENYNFLINID